MARKNNPQASKSAFIAAGDAELALWQAKSIAVLISSCDGDNLDAMQGAAFAVVELIASAESELVKITSDKVTPLHREQAQGAAA